MYCKGGGLVVIFSGPASQILNQTFGNVFAGMQQLQLNWILILELSYLSYLVFIYFEMICFCIYFT